MEKLDEIIEQLNKAVTAHGDQADFLEGTVKPLVAEKGKKDSPNKFLGKILGAGALVQGIKNRDQFGGGIKGALKGTGDALTSGGLVGKIKDGINARNEEINNKLDTIIAAVGGEEQPGADTFADVTSTSAGAAPLGMVDNKKFGQFMSSPQQSPYSNRTGGKNPTFDKEKAAVMMAVSDPNTDTSGLMFAKKGQDGYVYIRKANR